MAEAVDGPRISFVYLWCFSRVQERLKTAWTWVCVAIPTTSTVQHSPWLQPSATHTPNPRHLKANTARWISAFVTPGHHFPRHALHCDLIVDAAMDPKVVWSCSLHHQLQQSMLTTTLYLMMRCINFRCWNRCCLRATSKNEGKSIFSANYVDRLTLSGDVGGLMILAWSGCSNWLKRRCFCLSDGVGLLLEDCFSWLELVIIIGWFDCCAIGEGEAWTESIPESPPCSTLSECRRFDDDDGDCSMKVVSMCRI